MSDSSDSSSGLDTSLEGDIDLGLTDLEDEHVEVVLGGISAYQMHALKAGAMGKVAAAGTTLFRLAEENPEEVREAFLQNRDQFRIAQMPDRMLDFLNLELRDGTLYEATDEDDWTEVEIDG